MKKIKVTLGKTTLRDGWDYDVIYDKNIKPGKAKMCIEGRGKYHGKIMKSFVIDKAKNTMIVKGKTYKIKYKKLKKKNRKIAVKKAYKIQKKKGKLTFKKYKGNKKILVSKNGKITVKKGLKKGKYRIKVKVTASGNSCYKKITKTATITIKVR